MALLSFLLSSLPLLGVLAPGLLCSAGPFPPLAGAPPFIPFTRPTGIGSHGGLCAAPGTSSIFSPMASATAL